VQSATTRVWGSIGSAEIFAEGTAHTTTKWDVHYAGLARYLPTVAYRQGVAGGCWGWECACGRVERCTAERDYSHTKGNNNAHTHTRSASRWSN
jgi:hypothetical protein